VRRALALVALLVGLLAPPADTATRWGWLGVRIRDLSEQEMEDISKRFGMREGFGAVIVEVIKETPAAAAGLRNGDLVVAFRDRPVVDTRSLQRAIGSTTVGEMVRLTVHQGISGHGAGIVVFSLVTFTLIYGLLAVIWFWLIRRYVVEGPQEHDSEPAPPAPPGDEAAPLSFAY